MISLSKVPKTGLHNPFKNLNRYMIYGEISRKAASLMHQFDIQEHFVKLIQRVMPKHYA